MPRPARILIVQDRPESLDYQQRQLASAANAAGVPVQFDAFDLRRPSKGLLQRLQEGQIFYDWMVTDLLIDGVDHEPLRSAGMQLLRGLDAARLFHAYAPPCEPATGIRAIAVCSVCVDHGLCPNPDLRAELERLRIRNEFLARGGDLGRLAQRIADCLVQEGFGAAETESRHC